MQNINDNYVVVYKRLGDDPNAVNVVKPKITPVSVNRDAKSEFLSSTLNLMSRNILSQDVKMIEPKFIDFSKDLEIDEMNSLPILYKRNNENERFQISYVIAIGTNSDKKLKLATDYLQYLGTKNLSASQKAEDFYKLGCNLSVNTTSKETKITLTGLSNNFEKSINLLEDILANSIADEEALISLKTAYQKQKEDAKLNRQIILFSAMSSYAKYGNNSSFTNTINDKELELITSADLLNIIHSLTKFKHKSVILWS